MVNFTPKDAQQQLELFLQQPQSLQKLLSYVQSVFPSLRSEAEDIVQEVLREVWETLASPTNKNRWEAMHRRLNYYLNDLGKNWPAAWGNYLRSLAKWRTIDQLRRQVELPGLLQLAGDPSSDLAQTLQNFPDSDAPPDVIVQEAERRRRQARLLSGILKGFVIWCEEVPTRSQTKEVYERRLRGQSPNEIAEAMQITRNHVDVIVKRARDRIDGQIRQRDPHKSVFMTLLSQPKAKRPAVSPGSRFSRFEDVLHFVISEMGALCPSEERLWQYVRDKTRPEFSDIRYHVQVCRICQVELSRWLA